MWAKCRLSVGETGSYINDARDYSLLSGLFLRYPDAANRNTVSQIPLTLFPSPFPKKLYQECLNIQPLVHKLMLGIANDDTYMRESLETVTQADKFTAQLMRINDTVIREGRAQPIISCIDRADYMLNRKNCSSLSEFQVRQVEVNAIASAMSSHSKNASALHQTLLNKYRLFPEQNDSIVFPENNSLQVVVNGLIAAYDAYRKCDSYVLVITGENAANFSDFKAIEMEVLRMRPDIRIVSKVFTRLTTDHLKLGPNKELLMDYGKEIALVYYRYCYDPSHYELNESSWYMRLLIEQSRAIKCPSINFHLSGLKKFQQLLNTPKELERFLDQAQAERLSKVFCRFWTLDKQENGYSFDDFPLDELVLKPQREGGGHNIFGSNIATFLANLKTEQERSQYIMMEYIQSPKEKNWLIKRDETEEDDLSLLGEPSDVVSELGIFGNIIADGNSVIKEQSGGYLMRTKKFGVTEGGVSAGFAGISSLVLVDESADESSQGLFYNID